MNTEDVYVVGQLLTELKPVLKDVCLADFLPGIISKPSAYIVNSDTHHLPGRHWLVFYFPESGPAEFFDSTGHRPEFYHERFRTVLRANGPGYSLSNRILQSNGTRTCGLFALFYLWSRCRGYSMTCIVQGLFSTDVWVNERVVGHFLGRIKYICSE
jgi:hypothetical protein